MNGSGVRACAVAFAVLGAMPSVSAAKLEIAYSSLERMIVAHYLTEGGRRYLQGGPDDTCAYAFVQEPRVSAEGERLHVRLLFAGRAGTDVAGRCVGAGDNFDIDVSGIPRYEGGELYLDEVSIDADNKLFAVFSLLIERQIKPLLRVEAASHLGSAIAELTAAAGAVRLQELDIRSIELGADKVSMDADLFVSVTP